MQSTSSPVSIAQPALYPETLEANLLTGKFLVSSLREGAVYEVGLDGKPRKLVEDARLSSVLGIAVDVRRNRLLVTNSDLGASVKHSTHGAKKEAGLGIYDLTTGKALHYVDLTQLLPESNHLLNGITVDTEGNAYVTDSFSPVIYKVDPSGVASVFLQDDEFNGQAINLNGIVYHPDGFLLAVKKSTGTLYHIPLHAPREFSKVSLPRSFEGGDGLLLLRNQTLVLIANKTPAAASNAAFVLHSADGWSSAAFWSRASWAPSTPPPARRSVTSCTSCRATSTSGSALRMTHGERSRGWGGRVRFGRLEASLVCGRCMTNGHSSPRETRRRPQGRTPQRTRPNHGTSKHFVST